MSAEYLYDNYKCPFCGSDDIDPYHNMGSITDANGDKFSFDHYKCRNCGERGWEGLTNWEDE